jgi:hypothetical protein
LEGVEACLKIMCGVDVGRSLIAAGVKEAGGFVAH